MPTSDQVIAHCLFDSTPLLELVMRFVNCTLRNYWNEIRIQHKPFHQNCNLRNDWNEIRIKHIYLFVKNVFETDICKTKPQKPMAEIADENLATQYNSQVKISGPWTQNLKLPSHLHSDMEREGILTAVGIAMAYPLMLDYAFIARHRSQLIIWDI